MRKGGIVLSIGSSGGITNNDDWAKDIDLYPNRLASYIRTRYGAVQLVNKCIPSTTCADMLYNRHWWGNIRADIVTVKLGSNDASWSSTGKSSPDWAASVNYNAGINSGAISIPVTGSAGGYTLNLPTGTTTTSLGISVGMTLTGVGIGVGAQVTVANSAATTITVSQPNTSSIATSFVLRTQFVSSSSFTPPTPYITFNAGEDVMPADIVRDTSGLLSTTLFKDSTYVCYASHTAGSSMNYTNWTLGSVSWNVPNLVTALGTVSTSKGNWVSGTTYTPATSSAPPSVVLYRDDVRLPFETYYCLKSGSNTVVPGTDVTKWCKVQDNLFMFNRNLAYLTSLYTSGNDTRAGGIPTIAYEQNLIEIINQLRSRNPSVKIILCCPYWLWSGAAGDVGARRFNFKNYFEALDRIALATSTATSPVIICHLNNAYDDGGKYVGVDKLHLNTDGHKRVFSFTQAEGRALYDTNLLTNSSNPAFSFQTLDNTYGGLKSIIDGNPSWFVNWIDI
jgi:lysophospholipase L1-like esterase